MSARSLSTGRSLSQAIAFNPASVPGLVLWLDSARGIYQDTGFLTPTSVGQVVGGWRDLSGYSNHCSQSVVADKPTLTASGVSFDGTDDYLSSLLSLSGAKTIFVRFACTVAPGIGTDPIILSTSDGTLAQNLALVNVTGYQNVVLTYDFSGGSEAQGFSPVIDTLFHTLMMGTDGSNTIPGFFARYDGTTQVIPISQQPWITIPKSSAIGAEGDGTRNFYGTIKKLLIYDRGPLTYYAANFINASIQYLTHAETTTLRAGSKFSVSAWFYLNDTAINYHLIGKCAAFDHDEWFINFDNTRGNILLYGLDSVPQVLTHSEGSIVITPGAWHHVVMIYDGSQIGNANRLKCYVDGVQETLTFNTTIPSSIPAQTDGSFIMGAGVVNGSIYQPLNGRMTSVGFAQNVALTSAQVTQLYNSGNGYMFSYLPSGLGFTSYWDLQEASGVRADSIGSNILISNNGVGQAAGLPAVQQISAIETYMAQ